MVVLNKIITEEVKMILEAIRSGVSITDAEDRFLYINKSCQEMFGVTYEDVIGKKGSELEEEKIFYPEISSKAIAQKQRITEKQYNRFGDEYLVTAIPVFDGDKNLMYVIAYSSWDLVSVAELEEKYRELEMYNHRMRGEILTLRYNNEYDMSHIISENINTKNAINIINKMSCTDVPIFISGDSGTGKGFMASILHIKSSRENKPFIILDLKTINENFMEKEFFGSVRNVGVLELSNGGTLLIKHIELLPVSLQDKLYQIITDKFYINYNMCKIETDIRFVTTSEYSAKELLNKQKLISNLYYALCIITIDLPPLQERLDDLYEYILYFLGKFNEKYHKNVIISNKAIDEMLEYEWKENIHEVKNVLERMVIESTGNKIHAYELPKHIINEANNLDECQMDLKKSLEFYESKIINRAYEKYKSSVGVARKLDISQSTAVRKLQKYVKNYNKQEDYHE